MVAASKPSSAGIPENGLCEAESVLVLLSSWNGEKHISEQLESIRAQQGEFRLSLLIRDDGSSDGTVHLLHEFCANFENAEIHDDAENCENCANFENIEPPERFEKHAEVASEAYLSHARPGDKCRFSASYVEGTNKGFIASFFELLRFSESKADWYAFCDQDDVWQPDKLYRAIHMLRKAKDTHGEIPLLYASRLELVDERLHSIGYTRPVKVDPSFENALVENIATGATMVMNKAARDLVCEGLERLDTMDSECLGCIDTMAPECTDRLDTNAPFGAASMKDILLHDWWCYLVVSAFGRVLFDPESHILYRQHGENAVGQKAGFLDRQKHRLARLRNKGDVRGISRQAALFHNLYGEDLSEQKEQVLKRFLEKDSNWWSRIGCAWRPDTVRQTWYDGLLMRVLILFGKI